MTWQQIQDGLSKIDWGLVTGVIALIFTAISLQVQRKHNKLSVKPIAIISAGDYQDELAVHVQNKGTGPLIIMEKLRKPSLISLAQNSRMLFGVHL